MTKAHKDSNPVDPNLDDLLALHRYARSRHHGEKAAGGTFAEGDPELTPDRWWSLVARLERRFDCYLIKKRATIAGREVSGDLNWPEDGSLHIHDRHADPATSLKNKGHLTLAGEILGEIASIVAGYLAIADIVIRSSTKTKERAPEHQREAVRAWLTAERRRLHDIVVAVRAPDAEIERLGDWAGRDSFLADPRDAKDMAKTAVTSIVHENDPSTRDTPMSGAGAKRTELALPKFSAFTWPPSTGKEA